MLIFNADFDEVDAHGCNNDVTVVIAATFVVVAAVVAVAVAAALAFDVAFNFFRAQYAPKITLNET